MSHRVQSRSPIRGILVLVFLGVAALSLAVADPARAHGRSTSYSQWEFDGGEADEIAVHARVSHLELTRLGPEFSELRDGGQIVGDYLAARLWISAAGERCPIAESPTPRRAREGWLAYRWKVACTQAGPLVIESRILLEAAPSHLHFARIHSLDGGVREKVLTNAGSRWALADPNASDEANDDTRLGSSIPDYIRLGIEHILSGWDHLAFVFALLLLAGSLGEVARLVTGFTIAHSVTLCLAALGWLHPETAAVEAVIGFSVALVAAETGWELSGRARNVPRIAALGMLALFVLALRGVGVLSVTTAAGLGLFTFCHFGLLERSANPVRVRTLLAFCFGLVHGFGFAGVLAEVSLPSDRVVAALFGFNLGVEIGQLAVVLVAWPTLAWLIRSGREQIHRQLCEWGSAAICGLGVFWFVLRSFE